MINAIRDIRRVRGLSLQQVAARCVPPTTPQTVGRLEMGTRTLSLNWLRRIAAALEVNPADLVRLPEQTDLPVVAELGPDGARAPRRAARETAPAATPGGLAIRVVGGIGDYRAGDVLWCDRLVPDRFVEAINRDVLAPRPAGRFLFGRLLACEADRLLLLPPRAGARQAVVAGPAWIAIARWLVRTL